MSDPENLFEKTLTQLTELQAKVPELHEQYQNATHEKRSKDRRVSASVGPRGDLKSLAFHGESYRKMPAKELADLIVKTVNAAREQAVSEAREQVMQSLDPQLRGLLGGRDGNEDWDVNSMVDRILGSSGAMSSPVRGNGARDAATGGAA